MAECERRVKSWSLVLPLEVLHKSVQLSTKLPTKSGLKRNQATINYYFLHFSGHRDSTASPVSKETMSMSSGATLKELRGKTKRDLRNI